MGQGAYCPGAQNVPRRSPSHVVYQLQRQDWFQASSAGGFEVPESIRLEPVLLSSLPEPRLEDEGLYRLLPPGGEADGRGPRGLSVTAFPRAAVELARSLWL